MSWIAVVLAGLGLAFAYLRPGDSQVSVCGRLDLGQEWKEITSPKEMRTVAQWNELLIEVRGLRLHNGEGIRLEDGTRVEVEGFLLTADGERFDLNRKAAVAYSGKTFLRMSAETLESKTRDYSFRSVSLRSTGPLTLERVLWMSYDPREHKDGVAFPE